MARQSLRASPEGIATLKTTLKRKKWSQEHLAGAAGCSRQTIWSLLRGNAIDAEFFFNVCTQLELSEHEIAEADQIEEESGIVLEIDELVRQVRAQIKPWVQEKYGFMNVLSMSRPIGLGDIYTDVYILEKITGRKRLALKELAANSQEEDFERFGFSDLRKVERVSGLDAIDRCKKLVVLGKPGAGKTTFLKRVATQCNMGSFHPGLVPIFVPLKQFAETKGQPDLLTYIANQWAECKVKDSASKTETIFYEGRALVLLDGLDEVLKEDSTRVIEDIRQFSERFHNNLYVLTCRIATHEFKLEPFTEVEIADFDDQQIAVFVTRWFEQKNPARTESFLHKLKESPRIRELATNPLLLTLMCLGFEEAGYFSDSRAALYKEGLSVLLKVWDEKRRIERDTVYRQLTPERKEDLLSQLAYETFEQGQYFFSEEIAKQCISRYIANLSSASTEAEQLDVDSDAVLKSIEGQHGLLIPRAQGIYSFSHLTFQEYFTARKIAASCNHNSVEDETLQMLVQRVIDKRWREVFLLVAEILPSADRLLLCMKHQIDILLEKDDTLQKFLTWSMEQAALSHAPYKTSAIRAFYCSRIREVTLDLTSEEDLILAIDYNRSFAIDFVHALDSDFSDILNRAYELGVNLSHDLENNPVQVLEQVLRSSEVLSLFDTESTCLIHSALNCILEFDLETTLRKYLEQLKVQLPDPQSNLNILRLWWSNNGSSWSSKLQAVLILNPKLGHQWPLSKTQDRLLKLYFEANLLLANCLNSNCYVTRSVREEIEDTLLLPIAEIDKRKSGKIEVS